MYQFNEPEQIEALKGYKNLDSEIDNGFEEITELASLIYQTPFALITLTDRNKQWLKSKIDIEFPKNLLENPFRNYAFKNPGSILEISNALEDERFRNDPLVTAEPFIIFCAAIPLVLQDGQVLGTLCIMDQKPRKLTYGQLNILKKLGNRIVKQIVLYKNIAEQKKKHIITYQRLYEITSQSSDYIFTLDRNLNITYINHFDNEVPENVLYKKITSFIDPEFQDEYVKACNTSLEDLRIIEKDFLINTNTGKRWFSVKFFPLKNREGKADSLLIIANDINASMQIREELIMQQKILFEAQKISQTGSCEWDVQSGETIFSDELYNILGIEKGMELTHITALTDRIHPDDLKRAEELTVEAIKTLLPLLFQFRVITPKGELKYIDARGCPLVIKENKVISVLITLHDITEAVNFDKKLFTAVVQSEEKERARMAGELHDGVCQYLAGSKLMLTTIENTLKSESENLDIEAITGMVQYSKTTLIDALNLTQQISHNLLPVAFHKKGVIQSVKEMTVLLNSVDSIHYKVTTQGNDSELDPHISINIFRIVQEFIRNSQKYSEASQLDISIVINKKEIELEINDNGIGFDLNSVENKKGVGLLSMRKRIQSIGGTFTYKTLPGKGVRLRLKMIV